MTDLDGLERSLRDRLRGASASLDALDARQIVDARFERFLSTRLPLIRGALVDRGTLERISDDSRLARRDADQLGVLALLVLHVEHADGSGLDPHAGVDRVVEQDEGVEGIAVTAERVGDEPVVGRIRRRREQAPVEVDAAVLVVDLVLVAAAARDLDHDVDAAGPGFLRHRRDGTEP